MPPKAFSDALRLIELAEGRGVTLRLLGGLAILKHCPSANGGVLARSTAPDIDLVGLKRENTAIKRVLESQGFEPNAQFNAIHGYQRLLFHAPEGLPKVDIFLDRFLMCHALDLRLRLKLARVTLPLADLLFTKLQVVQMTEKDLKDIVAIFVDHDLARSEGSEVIDASYMAGLGADDWGVFTTLTDTLGKVSEFVPQVGLDPATEAMVQSRIRQLRDRMESEPKGIAWRLRAKVGRRVIWYELPEEPKAIPLGTDR